MRLSTHVLDAARGRPARNLAVTLEHRDSSGWTTLSTARTDGDGRIGTWSTGASGTEPGTVGDYRLIFATGPWFAAEGLPGFYPEVVVTFSVTDAGQHHHVPLLLSPFAYSTYRGS